MGFALSFLFILNSSRQKDSLPYFIPFVPTGFCPLMRITSTQPSTILSQLTSDDKPIDIKEKVIVWDEIISDQAIFDILEQEFYPFKKVWRISILYFTPKTSFPTRKGIFNEVI